MASPHESVTAPQFRAWVAELVELSNPISLFGEAGVATAVRAHRSVARGLLLQSQHFDSSSDFSQQLRAAFAAGWLRWFDANRAVVEAIRTDTGAPGKIAYEQSPGLEVIDQADAGWLEDPSPGVEVIDEADAEWLGDPDKDS